MILTPATVNAIYCVGRNYAEHAAELGNPVPGAPLIFMKSPSCIVPMDGEIVLPESLGRCDHELEIAVRLGAPLWRADADAALAAVSHVGLALDLTLRAEQDALKAKGHPWDLAKSFVSACPLSPLRPVSDPAELADLDLTLTINGEVRQAGHVRQMLFPIGTLLSFLSHRLPLVAGDLLLTGTPAGVGALRDGDALVARLCGEPVGSARIRR